MLVDRDAKILRFQKEKYYTVGIHSGSLKADSGRIADAETANSLKEKCTGAVAVCTSVKREKKTEQPPKLYDLTTLQREVEVYVLMPSAQKLHPWIVRTGKSEAFLCFVQPYILPIAAHPIVPLLQK